jgi:mono/diheme cytochrome c family protein
MKRLSGIIRRARGALSAGAALSGIALLSGLAACSTERGVNPVSEEARGGTARTLGMFSTELAEDMREQTLATLERDAFRREQRFLEAVSPGHLFQSTAAEQADIEGGRYSARELYELGAQLFNVTFTKEVGYGGKDLPPLARFHTGRRGGPDATRCASCHWRGGPAGAGDGADNAYLDGDGDSQKSALARNPIPLAGAGLVEILAREMTEDLANARAALQKTAKATGANARGDLNTKGVAFGVLEVRPDGSVDTKDVTGVDPDLVVRPFGWKGNMASIRDAVEDELLVHHGMQSDYLARTAGPSRVGPFPAPDPDGDGVESEISEGQVTALTIFLAMQEVPQITPPEGSDFVLLWSEGRARFQAIGCAGCHVPSLPLRSARYSLPSREGGPSVEVELAEDGAAPRIAQPAEGGGYVVHLFSDLKRHDVGLQLMENRADRGVARELFLTRPLWGVARSRPYMHDARAPTLEDAILYHAGDAQASRDAYAALTEPERAPVRVYLTSLTRARRMISP